MNAPEPADVGFDRLLRTLVERTVAVVLETTKDVQARDHVARCLQDRFGAPAFQPERILTYIRKEGG